MIMCKRKINLGILWAGGISKGFSGTLALICVPPILYAEFLQTFQKVLAFIFIIIQVFVDTPGFVSKKSKTRKELEKSVLMDAYDSLEGVDVGMWCNGFIFIPLV